MIPYKNDTVEMMTESYETTHSSPFRCSEPERIFRGLPIVTLG